MLPDQHVTELRRQRADPYHTLTRDGTGWVADFYGTPAEEFLRPLRRAFAKLAPHFTAVRESSTPGGESPGTPPPAH
jgi:hypothetical protein